MVVADALLLTSEVVSSLALVGVIGETAEEEAAVQRGTAAAAEEAAADRPFFLSTYRTEQHYISILR